MEQKNHFMGYYIKMFLTLLETCVVCFKRGCVTRPPDIYNIAINYDYSQWDCTKSEYEWAGYCLNLLISKCRKLTMDISIDMYMSWCEVDVDGSNERTLQLVVREAAYTCKEEIGSLSTGEFPDLSLLIVSINNFAVKPKSEDDEISEANIDTIISNLRNPEKNKKKWFCALVKNENLFRDDNYTTVVQDNMTLLDIESVFCLLGRVIEDVKNSKNPLQDNEKVKHFLFECIKTLPFESQLSLLEKVFKKYGNTSVLKSDEFEECLTEVLNKMVHHKEKPEKLHPNMILLCLQSGEGVIQRLLKDSLKSEHLCDIAIGLLTGIFPLSQLTTNGDSNVRIVTRLLTTMLKFGATMNQEEKENFVYLVKNLAKNTLLDIRYFLSEHLIALIESSVAEEEWSNILFWLDVLLPFADGSCGDGAVEKPVVELTFVIQVLNKCRRQPRFFTPLTIEACEKCINLVTILVDTIIKRKKEEDSEVIFLRGLATSFSPLTWYHMRELWTHWGQDLPPDDGFLNWSRPYLGHSGLTTLSDNSRAILVTSLCKVLPLLTTMEWKRIGTEVCDSSIHQSLALFNILLDGVLVLLQIPLMLRNLSCLSQTVVNFLTFIKVRTNPCLISSGSHTEATSVLKRIVLLINEIPGEIVNVRSGQILKVMQDVLITSLTKSKDEINISEIREVIDAISDCTIRSGLVKVFQENNVSTEDT